MQISVPRPHLMVDIIGATDEVLRHLEGRFPDTDIHVRGNEITVSGERAELVGRLLRELVSLAEQGQRIDRDMLERAIDMVEQDEEPSALASVVVRAPNGRQVRPKTTGQRDYIQAVRENLITFAVGPAGTGKTWLAVALAVEALQAKQVQRIVLTRPAVEAGERLGFLPGDLMAKVDPYLRPLYDGLHDMFDGETVQRLLERGSVEVAPLAFMRGRTLNDAFIILDEAQNTTPAQMKMFLTRLGFGSRAVVTGDITQIDVPGGQSGLVDVERLLGGITGMAFVRLGRRDVVRHRIVQDIVDAYEAAERL